MQTRVWRVLFTICLLVLAACRPGSTPTVLPTVTALVLPATGASATPVPASPTSSPPTSTTPTPSLPPIQASPTLVEEQTSGEPEGCTPTNVENASESAVLTLGPGTGIPASNAKGERMVITGTIYDQNCTPLEGVQMNVWQTDASGEYGPGHGTDQMQCCYYMGSVQTDADGRYTLITVKPGHYAGEAAPPPAHIHAEISHPDSPGLMVEIVFLGDPHLSIPPGGNSGYVPVELGQATDAEGDYLRGVADIILETSAPASGTGGGPRTFQIVTGQSQVSYQIQEKFADLVSMTSAVGVTRRIEGQLELDMSSQPFLKTLTMQVDLRGLETDDPYRDEKLADRWLVTNEFPYARFVSKGMKNAPERYTEGEEISFILEGDLTIRDITRPVSFESKAKLSGDTLTGTAMTTIRMSDFGVDPPNLLGFVKVEDEVLLRVILTAREGLSGE